MIYCPDTARVGGRERYPSRFHFALAQHIEIHNDYASIHRSAHRLFLAAQSHICRRAIIISRENAMSFDDRRKGQEGKFAHDAELRFKAEARRNKLLGLAVAQMLGKSGDDAASYAKEVVAADFEEAGDDDVVRKVLADLTAGGVAMTEGDLRNKMADLMDEAIAQIQAG
jgi:hypothetical protein